MASKSIDWDNVLLTKDPKKKEIEVSFLKVDGGTVVSFGDQPGTPAEVAEGDPTGPDGMPIPKALTPEGTPLAASTASSEACAPQDDSALYNWKAAEPTLLIQELYTAVAPTTLTDAQLSAGNGWRRYNKTTGGNVDLSISTLVRNNGVAAGPPEVGDIYAPEGSQLFSNGGIFTNIPDEFAAIMGTSVADTLTVSGNLFFYLWGRDATGASRESTVYPITAETLAYSEPAYSNFTTFPTRVRFSVTRDLFGGCTLVESVSGEVIDLPGDDITGAYHASYSNTYTIDASGNWTVIAEASVTQLASMSSMSKEVTNTGTFAPGTALYIKPVAGSDYHTQYFETDFDDGVVLAAYSTQDYDKGLSYIRAFERSMQDHTPPAYCARIP